MALRGRGRAAACPWASCVASEAGGCVCAIFGGLGRGRPRASPYHLAAGKHASSEATGLAAVLERGNLLESRGGAELPRILRCICVNTVPRGGAIGTAYAGLATHRWVALRASSPSCAGLSTSMPAPRLHLLPMSAAARPLNSTFVAEPCRSGGGWQLGGLCRPSLNSKVSRWPSLGGAGMRDLRNHVLSRFTVRWAHLV